MGYVLRKKCINTFGAKTNTNKDDIVISESAITHSSSGDYTRDNKTGQISRMKGGGHGQAAIDILEKANLVFGISYEYDNGVRVGFVKDHKNPNKRQPGGQTWFPKSWTEADIEKAGYYIANLYKHDKMKDGVSYFGTYNNVKVGIKLNDGKIATIFPDCKQDSKII